jgi:LPXTG-motif cell wall-anchored protein
VVNLVRMTGVGVLLALLAGWTLVRRRQAA